MGSIPILVDLDNEGSTLQITHPYTHSYPLRHIKAGDSMEVGGEKSYGWIVSLLCRIEERDWRQGRSKRDYVKPLYVSFFIINEKTYAFPLNFVYECLSVFQFEFMLFSTVWSYERFVLLVCDYRSKSMEWRASSWNEWSFVEQMTHRKQRIEISLISTFHIPV